MSVWRMETSDDLAGPFGKYSESKVSNCYDSSSMIQGVIIIHFWETAHLPLP